LKWISIKGNSASSTEKGKMNFKEYVRAHKLYRNRIQPVWIVVHKILTFLWWRLIGITKIAWNTKLARIAAQNTYVGDGIASRNNAEFLHSAEFNSSFSSGIEGVPTKYESYRSIHWRVHIYNWAVCLGLTTTQGDYVECGVWYGVLSKAYLENNCHPHSSSHFYLVDNWGQKELLKSNKRYAENIYATVQSRFSKYDNVTLIRGIIPKILTEIPSTKIGFLSVDLNSYLAERSVLEYFYPLMERGAVCYIDDFGCDFPLLRKEILEFLNGKNEKLLEFPTGQAIFIKS
jgi:O-methyltransferase